MNPHTPASTFLQLLKKAAPSAQAWIKGGEKYPQLNGLVSFYETPYKGLIVEGEIFGLPNILRPGSTDFYAMHIHQLGNCSMGFSQTGMHYNPTNQPHPQHAGDLLPLLGNQGYAWYAFYDKRFTISEIIGKSVIIHSQRDDFTTQPSGDSGDKIGCGVIVDLRS